MKKSLILANRVREHAIKMVNKGKSSHIGSVLSIVDIISVLYASVLNYRPESSKWDGRDRFILSKGHAGVGVYAVLAECGFFSTEKLKLHYQNDSCFSGHVSHKGIPGVELSTGSLGHGLPVGNGMAYAAKLDDKLHRIFVLMSDGELDEGSNWEAMLFSAHHKLNNITAIIDRNRLQSMDTTENTLALEPLIDKFEAFGWFVAEVNGHDHDDLYNALKSIHPDKPTMIIANTVKGKGVSFMENEIAWHYRTPLDSDFETAIKEIVGASK